MEASDAPFLTFQEDGPLADEAVVGRSSLWSRAGSAVGHSAAGARALVAGVRARGPALFRVASSTDALADALSSHASATEMGDRSERGSTFLLPCLDVGSFTHASPPARALEEPLLSLADYAAFADERPPPRWRTRTGALAKSKRVRAACCTGLALVGAYAAWLVFVLLNLRALAGCASPGSHCWTPRVLSASELCGQTSAVVELLADIRSPSRIAVAIHSARVEALLPRAVPEHTFRISAPPLLFCAPDTRVLHIATGKMHNGTRLLASDISAQFAHQLSGATHGSASPVLTGGSSQLRLRAAISWANASDLAAVLAPLLKSGELAGDGSRPQAYGIGASYDLMT
ncbi:hypothetical protein T492DRAFT_841768 [Pavlovales sp. CCMP2436]|nr:hypothetical protein T492DRAFT_841768 [Pavlovales sp. CCMP2436]